MSSDGTEPTVSPTPTIPPILDPAQEAALEAHVARLEALAARFVKVWAIIGPIVDRLAQSHPG